MSYEGEMLKRLAMPTRKDVEKSLLETLFRHNGVIREFATGEAIVEEIADLFSLNEEQRTAVLERTYRKENRVVKTPLWHRLLYRAADSLAKEQLVTRPTDSLKLFKKREWMLTETGIDRAVELLHIPQARREMLPVKSFEIQKGLDKIAKTPSPEDYNPLGTAKQSKTITRKTKIRSRIFRQAVIESYDFRCCVCGLKIHSPDTLYWEVEAAHIVPHTLNGKDDVWNGIALCRLHHWAFDVGWFTFSDDYRLQVSPCWVNLHEDFGAADGYHFFREGLVENKPISLPTNAFLYPHKNSLLWHRENVFYS